MLDSELAEIISNLRLLGSDIADIEVKNGSGGLPKSLRETLSAFSNSGGGVVILGLDEGQGFATAYGTKREARGRPRVDVFIGDGTRGAAADMRPPVRRPAARGRGDP